jgi:hypothetical protein
MCIWIVSLSVYAVRGQVHIQQMHQESPAHEDSMVVLYRGAFGRMRSFV